MIVWKSDVGKSTLINNLLNLKGDKKAKHGVGYIQTTDIKDYRNEDFPLLGLIETRDIELNNNYGADAEKEVTKFTSDQINNTDPNNFAQCILYCITRNRFEQVEINLLIALSESYDNNHITINTPPTQSKDNNAFNGMRAYIEKKI